MSCCIQELRNKDVICSSNGCRLGNVDDVEIDVTSGRLVCIVIFERGHMFSKGCDIKIPWENIKVIGDDTILVDYCRPNNPAPPPKRRFF
ncbi:MAG: YlmC/YmxH family sporulation protein [Clostridia bacterium]|nr:YlmC/YmxH family sporulation protein [Clostridia bacterium]